MYVFSRQSKFSCWIPKSRTCGSPWESFRRTTAVWNRPMRAMSTRPRSNSGTYLLKQTNESNEYETQVKLRYKLTETDQWEQWIQNPGQTRVETDQWEQWIWNPGQLGYKITETNKINEYESNQTWVLPVIFFKQTSASDEYI